MIRATLSPEQEAWVASQIPPAPEVFVCAFPRCCGEWRVVATLTAAEYAAHPPAAWEKRCIDQYPSTLLVKVYTSNTDLSRGEPAAGET